MKITYYNDFNFFNFKDFINLQKKYLPIYDELFILYQKEYCSDSQFTPISFSLKTKNDLIFCPATIDVSKNKKKTLNFFGYPFEIMSNNKMSLKLNEILFLELNKIKSKHNIKEVLFKFEIDSIDTKELADKNNKVNEIFSENKIDLKNSIDNIIKGFSKGHKSSVKINYPEINYEIIDFNNYKKNNIKEMQAVHLLVAQKKTRTDKTWLIMEDMILKKKGFLIKIQKNNVTIGYSFFSTNYYSSSLFSSCIFRENFISYKNLNHKAILKGLEYLKSKECKFFFTGRTKTLYSNNKNFSDENLKKNKNLEKFRSSFGGIESKYITYNKVPNNPI